MDDPVLAAIFEEIDTRRWHVVIEGPGSPWDCAIWKSAGHCAAGADPIGWGQSWDRSSPVVAIQKAFVKATGASDV